MAWGLLLSLIISLPAKAYVGSVSAATGGSGRAAIEASDSPFMNPAAVAHLTGYYFTMAYGSGGNSQADADVMALSLTDNMRETVVPTSMAYYQSTDRTRGEEHSQKNFRLSLANFINPQLAFGLGIVHQQDYLPQVSYSQTNMDLGVLWAPNKDIGFGAMVSNAFGPAANIPQGQKLNRQWALAGSYNYQQFMRLKADILQEEEGLSYGLGIENYMNRWLVFRLGYKNATAQSYHLYSGGLGFVGPRFGLHYAYQASPQGAIYERHSVDLAIPIW